MYNTKILSEDTCLYSFFLFILTGNVLVLMPSYEEIIRLDFYILKQKLIGNLPQMISIHLLHSGVDKDQLEALIQPKCITIVLATAVVLRMGFLRSFSYVIDTGRIEYTAYHVDKMCEQVSYKWVSKESIENRNKFAGRVKGNIIKFNNCVL